MAHQTNSPLTPAAREKTHTVCFTPAGKQRTPLDELAKASYVLLEDLERLPFSAKEELVSCQEMKALLPQLVKHGLLTQYQSDRIEVGRTFGLLLGNYRVLSRL